MKNLTRQEYEDAPAMIRFIIKCRSMNIPILYEYFESAIKEYPEYFPDVIKHREELVEKPGTLDGDYNIPIITQQVKIVDPKRDMSDVIGIIKGFYEYKDWIEKRNGKYEKKSR